ncbi:unnamed protein product [Thelazia callipaeda]|uniref:Arrestin_C domain-containing protein n=1 Tax=Thelazia callipaeda TaxID=103827 RepID=A0A0N5D3T1_THECL|nr:unnamed protein product [Thelazia callipaeda]
MSDTLTGRARVVYVSNDFIHLSKGGLDGKIVAFRDSWLGNNYELQDWVTFKAKSYEGDPSHAYFGVRFKALSKSVKFESKAVVSEGVGTLFKVDEHQGQYGFIYTNDGSTVYFTASVVRPDTHDIRNTFKAGVQLKYKAVEQKQSTCRWRAIAVCNKNATLDNPLTSLTRKAFQNSTTAMNSKYVNGDGQQSDTVQATARSPTLLSHNTFTQSTNQTIPSGVSRFLPRSKISEIDSSRLSLSPLLSVNPPTASATFADSSGKRVKLILAGDAYEDAVRILAYFRHLVTKCSFAKLDRESAVYLAGEAIQCKVVLRNIGRDEESLAWGSVHVQCERIVRANKFNALVSKKCSMEEKPQDIGTTAMSRSAFTVFSCRPVILFCELILNVGESRDFECTQQLPLDSIPPSFKGHLVRYVYKLTLGVQHVKSPIKLIHIPLRIIQCDLGLTLPSLRTSKNPFIDNHNPGPSIVELATEAADCLTAPQGDYKYSMTNAVGRVANFLLNKKSYKLGEDVVGRFNFDGCAVRCLQFAVYLQSVETLINEEWYPNTFVATHMTEHAVCAYWTEAAVRLHVPLSATPTFCTDTVHLKWRLHFEFVICNNFNEEVNEGLWQAPENVNIETMSWDLDIKVFPCSPHNAGLTIPNLSPPASIVV